jgi:hypothetical protein
LKKKRTDHIQPGIITEDVVSLDEGPVMTPRFQFSLRALLAWVTVVAVVTRIVQLGVPPVTLLIAALGCFPLAGLAFRRPLEGILATMFLIIVASWVGMTVLAVALGN